MVQSKKKAKAIFTKVTKKETTFFSKVKPFLELVRINNCVIASIAVAIGFLVSGGNAVHSLLVVMASAFLICGGGQSINDYFDAKVDSKLNKNKPIPSGKITKNNALIFSAGLYILGLILASFINETTTIIAVIMIILLSIYSAMLPTLKWIGNYVVALGTAITFIFGAAATNNIFTLVLFFFATAFFSNMAREITKDLEDMKKDKGYKKTLPLVIGEQKARLFVYLFHIIAAAIAIDAYIMYNLGIIYLLAIIIATVIFGIAVEQSTEKNYSMSQQSCKKGMLVSLIAFISVLFK